MVRSKPLMGMGSSVNGLTKGSVVAGKIQNG